MKFSVLPILIFLFVSLVFAEFPKSDDLDNEYEIDIFMDYFLPERNFAYLASSSGIRVTAGSLDIKRLYLQEELKIKLPLVNDKLWTRFFHIRNKTIDYERTFDEIEFEYSPLSKIYLSVLGTPEFYKHNADLGWAIRYAKDEGNGFKLAYILADFDNNYAFQHRTTNLGFEKFYQKTPKKWRIEIKKIGHNIKSYIFFECNTKSVFSYDDLMDTTKNYSESHESYFIDSNFSLSICSNWKFCTDFYIRETKNKKEFTIPQQAQDFNDAEKKYLVRPFVEQYLLNSVRLFYGFSFVKHYLSLQNYDYTRTNIGGFLSVVLNICSNTELEVGYIHDDVDWTKNSQSEYNRENRLKLAIEYKFTEKSQIKLITGWDLDKEDWGTFAFFDGGHIQLQILF
ncbi:MAG: hypothetical protein AB1349_01305 [Elusimicrobiota bacterium]